MEFIRLTIVVHVGYYLLVFMKLSGNVQYVLVRGQRHRERVALDDTVQREFFHFQRVVDVDQGTHAGDYVGHHGCGLRVDHGLTATR